MSIQGDSDAEVLAIQTIVSALTPLDAEARGRVISYVFSRMGLRASVSAAGPTTSTPEERQPEPYGPRRGLDIRSFKNEKDPQSAIEMAAIVAYYVSELAPADEHRDAIDAEDIKRYFKLAQFPLPQKTHMTLVHTKNAGYIDSVGEGRYRLNPVGYNLVAYSLPGGASRPKKQGKKSRPSKKG